MTLDRTGPTTAEERSTWRRNLQAVKHKVPLYEFVFRLMEERDALEERVDELLNRWRRP